MAITCGWSELRSATTSDLSGFDDFLVALTEDIDLDRDDGVVESAPEGMEKARSSVTNDVKCWTRSLAMKLRKEVEGSLAP